MRYSNLFRFKVHADQRPPPTTRRHDSLKATKLRTVTADADRLSCGLPPPAVATGTACLAGHGAAASLAASLATTAAGAAGGRSPLLGVVVWRITSRLMSPSTASYRVSANMQGEQKTMQACVTTRAAYSSRVVRKTKRPFVRARSSLIERPGRLLRSSKCLGNDYYEEESEELTHRPPARRA